MEVVLPAWTCVIYLRERMQMSARCTPGKGDCSSRLGWTVSSRLSARGACRDGARWSLRGSEWLRLGEIGVGKSGRLGWGDSGRLASDRTVLQNRLSQLSFLEKYFGNSRKLTTQPLVNMEMLIKVPYIA